MGPRAANQCAALSGRPRCLGSGVRTQHAGLGVGLGEVGPGSAWAKDEVCVRVSFGLI